MTSEPAILETRPTLSVVVPTYREAANIPVLFERLKTTLAGLPWEMIVVDDDSSDGTADVAFALAARDPRLRCIRRVNRVGLAGAVVEGWLSSSADFVAVIDGDLQHDESILPKMYEALATARGNLAVGTRVADATAPGGLSPARQKLSDLGAWFFRRLAGTAVSDPMSGFFMIRREIVSRLAPRLSPDGFKILVDVVLSCGGGLKVVEIPYVFRPRQAGESKLSPLVGLDFLGLVAHHASGGVLPIRFVLFASIGAIGLVVHLFVLAGADRMAFAGELRGEPDRGDDRGDGEQFPAQQRDHLPRLPLSRAGDGGRLRAVRAAVQRRRDRQRRHRLVAFPARTPLVGGGARRRARRRRVELRGEHHHRLAQAAHGAESGAKRRISPCSRTRSTPSRRLLAPLSPRHGEVACVDGGGAAPRLARP